MELGFYNNLAQHRKCQQFVFQNHSTLLGSGTLCAVCTWSLKDNQKKTLQPSKSLLLTSSVLVTWQHIFLARANKCSCHVTTSVLATWQQEFLSHDNKCSWHVTTSVLVTWPQVFLPRDNKSSCHVTTSVLDTWPQEFLSCDNKCSWHVTTSVLVTWPQVFLSRANKCSCLVATNVLIFSLLGTTQVKKLSSACQKTPCWYRITRGTPRENVYAWHVARNPWLNTIT